MERLTHEADFGLEDWEETLFFVKSDPNGAYNILDIARFQGEAEFDEILKNIALRLAAYEDTGLTPEEVQQMRWIPVEERLPEPNTGDGYWVAKKGPRGNTMMKLAQYSDYGMAMSIDAVTDITWRDWDFTKITNVTHWMPLPKAPKEDSHD